MTETPALADRAFRAIEVPLNLHWSLAQRLCHFDASANFLLFADPRGGSTWLAETLQSGLELEMLWEPLQPKLIPRWGDLGFGWRQYIPPEAEWLEARRAFAELLGGRLLNRHICKYSSPLELVASERVLVKFCRGNALLPWLVRQFRFVHAPVYLARHPFAVAASQMSHGHWEQVGYRFDPSAPFSEREAEHADYLSTLTTRAELLVAIWCLHNSPALDHPPEDRAWISVFYEVLLTEPEAELRRIFAAWGMDMPQRVLDAVRRPSKMTKDASALHDSAKQVAKWRSKFEAEDIERMLAVLVHFGVTAYSDAIMPHTSD